MTSVAMTTVEQTDQTGSCVTCHRRDPYRDHVCEPCRVRLDRELRELPDLYALLPMAIEPGTPGPQLRVSGTEERPLPGGEALNLTAGGNLWTTGSFSPKHRTWTEQVAVTFVDEQGETVTATQTVWHREPVVDPFGRPVLVPDGDQVGDINPAVLVAAWIDDWVAQRRMREHGPRPHLAEQVGWLLARLDWACERHTAMEEFAAELHRTHAVLRGVLAVRRHVERYPKRCPKCDMWTLSREIDPWKPIHSATDKSPWIECGNCHNLFTETELGVGLGQVA